MHVLPCAVVLSHAAPSSQASPAPCVQGEDDWMTKYFFAGEECSCLGSCLPACLLCPPCVVGVLLHAALLSAVHGGGCAPGSCT